MKAGSGALRLTKSPPGDSLISRIFPHDMSTRIKLNHAFQPFAGHRDVVEVPCNTVSECLDSLIGLYPAFGKILFDDGILQVLVFYRGELIVPDELDRPVSGPGELSLMPMIQGG